MTETKLKIDGMMCGMCESHINDAIRRAFNVKKVTSSHSKGETVVLSCARRGCAGFVVRCPARPGGQDATVNSGSPSC